MRIMYAVAHMQLGGDSRGVHCACQGGRPWLMCVHNAASCRMELM